MRHTRAGHVYARGYLGLWLLSLALLLMACAGGQKAMRDSPAQGKRSGPTPSYYVVRKGDTLFAIAWRYQLDYQDLAVWNRIPNPDRIYIGQQLRLSPPQRLSEHEAPRSTRRQARSAAQGRGRISREALDGQALRITPADRKDDSASDRSRLTWAWPTQGQLLRSFSSAEPGKKGIDIAGILGQPVFAAAAGKVVYSGDGLLGYGPLVIIKHNDTFLSAYAYNGKLLVREGEQVALGQRIAEMGTNGTDRGMLHFEIRRYGRPVDPMLYLPARPYHVWR